MNKSVQLPVTFTPFASYQSVSATSLAIASNPEAYNQIINNCVSIHAHRNFLRGHSAFFIHLTNTHLYGVPILEKWTVSLKYAWEFADIIIKNMLDDGYYVYFSGLDDYYLPGKSWYGTRHFPHDGTISGYDDEKGTYTVVAYDINWVIKAITIPQSSFTQAIKGAFELNTYGTLCAVKSKNDKVNIDVKLIIKNIKTYLDSDLTKFPPEKDGNYTGLVVHDYLCLYLGKLIDGSIPYDKMDWRPLRVIWEHKKCMFDRIRILEEKLGLDGSRGARYEEAVKEADRLRILYSFYHKKKRDGILDAIIKGIEKIKEIEAAVLSEIVAEAEKQFK